MRLSSCDHFHQNKFLDTKFSVTEVKLKEAPVETPPPEGGCGC